MWIAVYIEYVGVSSPSPVHALYMTDLDILRTISFTMSASNKPTIVIVPGAWQRIIAFHPFANRLKDCGYNVECVGVPSTGGTELPLTGLSEDIAAIRAVLQPLSEQGKEIIVLTHSAGGVSGSGAVKGLDAKSRKEAGLSGGVVRVIYMAAFMIPKGVSIMDMLGGQPLPWMKLEVR